MGIYLPECAQYVLKQEMRFKHYKDHLELCVKDFSEVCDSVRTEMSSLFKVHMGRTLQYFHPGLSTLSWDSMNIGQCLPVLLCNLANKSIIISAIIILEQA